MVIYYSASTGGFYDPKLHGDAIPFDSVEITSEYHQQLLSGQSAGKRITPDASGFPVLADPPALTPEELLEEIRNKRQSAYQQEADPLFFRAQRGEVPLYDWVVKVDEIKTRYPKPE